MSALCATMHAPTKPPMRTNPAGQDGAGPLAMSEAECRAPRIAGKWAIAREAEIRKRRFACWKKPLTNIPTSGLFP